MTQKINDFVAEVAKTNPNEPEFLQAVHEVAETVIPFIEDNPKYKKEINSIRELEKVFLIRSIYAQRPLDDTSDDKEERLSKNFEAYYKQKSKNKQAIDKGKIINKKVPFTPIIFMVCWIICAVSIPSDST